MRLIDRSDPFDLIALFAGIHDAGATDDVLGLDYNSNEEQRVALKYIGCNLFKRYARAQNLILTQADLIEERLLQFCDHIALRGRELELTPARLLADIQIRRGEWPAYSQGKLPRQLVQQTLAMLFDDASQVWGIKQLRRHSIYEMHTTTTLRTKHITRR